MSSLAETDWRSILSDLKSPINKIMSAVSEGEARLLQRSASIGLSANVTIELLSLFLRREALLSNVKLDVHQGSYDDPLGDIEMFLKNGVENLLLLPFFDNLLPSLEAQAGHLSEDTIISKVAEFRSKYTIVLEHAQPFRMVFAGTLHDFATSAYDAKVAAVLDQFNRCLKDLASGFANVRMIDLDDVLREVGRDVAFDARFYFRGKAPYSPVFLSAFARRIALASRGFNTYFYKALVLDCDNTLWGGIVGEELLCGIKLEPYDYPGNIFWRAQNEFLSLERNGVLLVLCSKNNPTDVDEVLSKHPHMVLRDKDIFIKKVNWTDKVQNLKEIATELNIGPDSLIFLDDSPFECAAVRAQLPMVRTFQVPKSLPEYPHVLRQIKDLFLAGGVSEESKSKTAQYRQRAQVEELKSQFASHEGYLASLGLRVELKRNAIESIPRISELSMKSNQFNLTTRRYTENEIEQLMKAPNSAVYSFKVSDRFGDAGLTGVIIAKFNDSVMQVENLLMSCRVIGRGVEFAFWPALAQGARERGCDEIHSEFIPSAKNAQVSDYYDKVGFVEVKETGGHHVYRATLGEFKAPPTPWVEVTYVG
jgi:FkbH-like protein